jgi:hypothetical protein
MGKKRAFVRYSTQGKIVPGSLILTEGSYPQGPAIWNEVAADLISHPTNPASYKTTVQSFYSNAATASNFIKRVKAFVRTQGYLYNNLLLSTDVCSDDVNAVETLNNLGQTSSEQADFLGPFFGSGLAGYPHTGVLGLQAWASHITNTSNGGLILINMPHIGISQAGNAGRIWRKGKTQAQSLTDNTCGAVATAATWVIGNATLPTYNTGVFADNDQHYKLCAILLPFRATILASYDFVTTPSLYGASMVYCTEKIRVAGDTFLTGASGIIAANVGTNVDVFYCSGTFINVDDGYNPYVKVTSFKKYNSTNSPVWTDLTTPFLNGL